MDLAVLPQPRVEQTLAISPATVAFAELLCLALPELAETVEREVAQNPALERTADFTADALAIDLAASVADQPTDAARLLADARLALPERDRPLAELVVASLDERGFLTGGVEELARSFNLDARRLERVLGEVRAAGPPGVGACDLRECLLLQIDRIDSPHPLARKLVEDHLDGIAAGRFSTIARQLGVERRDVLAARDFVRERLRPAPDFCAAARSPQQPIVDIVVDEQLQVSLTEPARFGVRVAPLYAELAEHGSDADRRHARVQVDKARAFATRLEQRWETVRAVAQETIGRQSHFVRGDERAIRPLTRAIVARSLGLHESTVSRATRDRHLRLPDGRVAAMSCLFSAGACGAREALRELLADESVRPRPDAELVAALASRGYTVARRTIAKYRAELGVSRCALR